MGTAAPPQPSGPAPTQDAGGAATGAVAPAHSLAGPHPAPASSRYPPLHPPQALRLCHRETSLEGEARGSRTAPRSRSARVETSELASAPDPSAHAAPLLPSALARGPRGAKGRGLGDPATRPSGA